jgi:porin
MTRILIALYLLFIIHVRLASQVTDADSTKTVRLEASYLGDIPGVLTGGIHTGTCYLGMANIRISFSTQAAHLWNGGLLYFNAANTHGDMPSDNLIGDYQVASNIEAGNHTFLQELWYKQVLGRTEITAGLQDLNINFANTSNGALFLNSSLGILPTVSSNITAPVFPLTSLGLAVKWQMSDKSALLASIFDGSPTDFEENPYNLKWQFNKGDGILFFTEYELAASFSGLPGVFKAGVYLHQHLSASNDHNGDLNSRYSNNNGIYVIADQVLWKHQNNNRCLSAFLQLGLCPKQENRNQYYTGFGLHYTGILNRSGNDEAGIAVAHVGLKGNTGDETTLELTYKIPVIRQFFLKPDIQYIINPAGTVEQLNNCLVVILRFGISL